MRGAIRPGLRRAIRRDMRGAMMAEARYEAH
jgi:hypothetical protein